MKAALIVLLACAAVASAAPEALSSKTFPEVTADGKVRVELFIVICTIYPRLRTTPRRFMSQI